MVKKVLCPTRPSKPRCLGRSRLLYALYSLRLSWQFAMRYALCAMPPHPLPLPRGERGRVRGTLRSSFLLSAMLSALCVFILLGCQTAISRLRPPLENEGEVYLYLQSLPQEAERLRFTIEGISALSPDGRAFPLLLSLREIKGRDLRRQRLLAFGPLPPGTYSGLLFKVKSAILTGEDGEAALFIPEEPARIDFPFNLSRKKAQLLSLTFKYKESIKGGFSFSPVFSVLIPARPLTSLTGYVTNHDSNNIIVFDKRLNQAASVIVTGRGPAGMALDPMRRRAYVALTGDDTIEYIDVAAGEVFDRIRLNTGDHPQEIVLTPDGKMLLSVNAGSNTVSFIDPLSLLEISRINVGRGPNSILLDRTGRKAFVFNTVSSTVSVLDVPNRRLITNISTGSGPLRGQLNRRGDRLYVIHELTSYLAAIDPNLLTVVGSFKVKMGMNAIKVDTNTDLIYLGRKSDIMVEAYNPFSFVPVDYVRTGGGTNYMSIDGEVSNLYILNSETKNLMVFNLNSKKMVAEMDVGEGPYWVTMMGER